ncbi:MAG TPA: hypothetical protein VGX91_00965 [Candidatus Cybelea sp.]|nr:hypothetical protein [Candidatus Cybelea sp.]
MKTFDFSRYAMSSCASAAILASCGGSPPIGAPAAIPQAAIAAQSERGTSSMPPGAKSGDLLYAALGRADEVDVFSFPQGKLIETLTGLNYPSGLCSDGAGNVWVATLYGNGGKMFEYAHGGTSPVKSLDDPSFYPSGCSVDPRSGDLAVTNNSFDGPGSLAIYQRARGKALLHYTPILYDYDFCGYDNKGNLFVDGPGVLAELTKGGNTFTTINVDNGSPGGQVQWDGKYITFATSNSSAIYRVKVSGSVGTVVGVTYLSGVGTQMTSSWTQAATSLVPTGKNSERIGLWKYPAGGKPFALLRLGKRSHVHAVTLSLARNRV